MEGGSKDEEQSGVFQLDLHSGGVYVDKDSQLELCPGNVGQSKSMGQNNGNRGSMVDKQCPISQPMEPRHDDFHEHTLSGGNGSSRGNIDIDNSDTLIHERVGHANGARGVDPNLAVARSHSSVKQWDCSNDDCSKDASPLVS